MRKFLRACANHLPYLKNHMEYHRLLETQLAERDKQLSCYEGDEEKRREEKRREEKRREEKRREEKIIRNYSDETVIYAMKRFCT